MATASTVDIIIDHNSVIFSPGEIIKGAVTLNLSKHITVNEINVTCAGEAVVTWSVGFGDKATNYFDRETYINFDESLYERGKGDGSFSRGQHTFPFHIQLPDDIPCSFEGPSCYIRYKIRATVKEEKKFLADSVRKLHFKVKNNARVDLNELPLASESQTRRATKEHRTCWGSGPISASFSIDRSGYIPGQHITYRVQIENHTGVGLKPPEVKLYRTVIRRVRFGPSKAVESRVDVKLEKMRNIYREIENAVGIDWKNARLLIRPGTLPVINHCEVIKLAYYICLEIKPFHLKIPLDITMGTIPLRGESGKRKSRVKETTTVSRMPLPEVGLDVGTSSDEDESTAMTTSTPMAEGFSTAVVKVPGKSLKEKRSNLNFDTSEAESPYPHSDSGNTSGAELTQEETLLAEEYNIGQDNKKLLSFHF